MEKFNDLFDSIDDNGDSLQYTVDELNHYFHSNHLNLPLTTEDFCDDHLFNELTDMLTSQHEQDNETVLSQKFSQLSTKYESTTTTFVSKKRPLATTTISTHLNKKKIKMEVTDTDTDTADEIELLKDEMLPYLSTENEIFMDMANNLVASNATLTIQDIQHVAVIMHRIGILRMKQDMNTIYLQSVKGTIPGLTYNVTDVDRRVWSLQVKSMMLTKYKSFIDSSMNIDRRFHPVCENLLKEQIQEVDRDIELLQKQLHDKRRSLSALDSTLEKTIHDFVHRIGLKPFKIKTDFKIAIIKYEYEAEIVQRLFAKEDPNSYQIQSTKSLFDSRRALEKSRQALLEFKERIFYNKLSTDEKLTQYNRLDELKDQIKQLEQEFYWNQTMFDADLSDILKHHRQAFQPFGLTTKQMNLVLLRLKNIVNRWRDIHQYRLNYYVRNAYDQSNINTNVLISTLINNTKSSLTDRQRQLLNRGPTYVPPCQMYAASPTKSYDDIVKQQFAPLEYQLNHLFTKYNLQSGLKEEFLKKIFDQFNEYFRITIPEDLQRRAIYEKRLIQSIQTSLNKNNLILRRTANQKNMFYLGDRSKFENYVNEYLAKCDLYEVVWSPYNENIITYVQMKFNEMNQTIHGLLDEFVCQQYCSDTNNFRITQAYFLPDFATTDNRIQVVPWISSSQTATWQIGLFLDQLLRPLVTQVSQSMLFHDEIDFLNKLHDHAIGHQRLQRKNLFCTIRITNFQALDTHTNVLTMTEQFLERHVPSKKLQDIPISTIRHLLSLFLQNNFFTYKENIYRFVKGSPTTMSLTETLANIYLFAWQEHICNSIKGKEEIFGRYKDQIFFTLNQFSDKDIRDCLKTLKDNYPQVQFQRLIGPSVIYINTYIENRSGILYTRLHHDSTLDKYTLPYVNGHVKLAYSDYLRSALFQTICSCSNVNDFQDERITLELAYLLNGYSLPFIQTHLKHFFSHFSATPVRYGLHQGSYDQFRQQCFDYLESKRTPFEQRQSIDDTFRDIHFSYIYEYGAKSQFNRHFLQLWSQYFDYYPILSSKISSIRIAPRDFRSLNDFLTQ